MECYYSINMSKSELQDVYDALVFSDTEDSLNMAQQIKEQFAFIDTDESE